MDDIIKLKRSIIPACDVGLDRFKDIVAQTADIEKIGAYKIGFQLGLSHGLPSVVKAAREFSDKPIIYDHQKAATDIPDTGKNFAEVLSSAEVDTVILFPQAGPATQQAWIDYCKDAGLNVIVGGLMTHEKYVRSQGGYIADEGIDEIYLNAAKSGIKDFVVPGNKPDEIQRIKDMLEKSGVAPTFYSPGLVTQGGDITDSGAAAGERWHAIVGRGIYNAESIRSAAEDLTSKI
jgi:orotidine-5'-phosphate decarboxylase